MKLPQDLRDRIEYIKDKHRAEELKQQEECKSLINEEESIAAEDLENKEIRISLCRQRLMLVSITFLQFCVLCGDSSIFPFFPQEAEKRGLNNIEIGLVFSAYEISRFITMPIFGSLLLKWPPRNMCIVGSFVSGVMFIAFGLLGLISQRYLFLGLCVAARLGAGAGSSLLTVASQSILLKATSFTTNTVIGSMEIAIGAGMAVGPALGSAFFVLGGFGLVFWVIGGMTLVLSVIICYFVPTVEGKGREKKNIWDLLKIPGIFLLFVHSIIIKIDGRILSTEISIYITTQFNQTQATMGLLFGAWSILYIVVCAIQSKVTDKGYVYSAMVLGLALNIPTALLICPSPILNFIFHGKRYFWLTVVAMALRNMLSALLYIPPFQASLNLATIAGHPADSLHTYGMITGILNSGLALGAVLGPLIGGAITQATDFSWTTTAVTSWDLLMLAAFIIYLVTMKIKGKPLTPATAVGQKKHQSETTDEATEHIETSRVEPDQSEASSDENDQLVTLELISASKRERPD